MLAAYRDFVANHRDSSARQVSRARQELDELRIEFERLGRGMFRRISPSAWLMRRMTTRQIREATRGLLWLEGQMRADDEDLQSISGAAGWSLIGIDTRLQKVRKEKESVTKGRRGVSEDLLRTPNPIGAPWLSDDYYELVIRAEVELEALRHELARAGGAN